MEQQQKVLWTEGMFLTPHHFQQWDRYYEHLLQQRLHNLAPLAWGVRELAINEEALANGQVSVSRLSATLPDGLLINAPGTDDPPAARDVGDKFPAEKERLGVFLAAPIAPEGGVAQDPTGQHDGRPTRYRQKTVRSRDENADAGHRDIHVAAKHLRILFEGESLDDHSWIKIAELGKSSTGGFTLDEHFVAPCLSVGASAVLMGRLRKILDILATKSTEFSRQRRNRGAGLASFSTSESASFWLLHTVNGFIPPLQHMFNAGTHHPEQIYLTLSQLTGYMYTFAGEGHPKDVTPYQHEDLGGTFLRLEEKLRGLLDTIIPTKCTNIPLDITRDNMFVAKIQDDRVLQPEGAIYVAIQADVPAEKVVREAPLKIKISSQDRVDQLITAALRGITVRHVPVPPPDVPVQPGRNYFQIDKAGDHWDAVRNSRSLALYLPPEFQGLKLELMAVKE
ncbi:MAG: type VI secretion system baseplate subunit TssK [Planctomycetes bacterium]|nr:type VI secretion system baseplate subunit TssK [Planctomycetota bacterium]MCA8935383.1 type VI secretion system baseplate subunit TssK [Planctomycetota bacterium]